MNDKTKRMKKSKRTFMLAIIVASLFMLLISIFNVSLSDVNKYVVLLPTSATIALAVLFEEIYEKISD